MVTIESSSSDTQNIYHNNFKKTSDLNLIYIIFSVYQ